MVICNRAQCLQPSMCPLVARHFRDNKCGLLGDTQMSMSVNLGQESSQTAALISVQPFDFSPPLTVASQGKIPRVSTEEVAQVLQG